MARKLRLKVLYVLFAFFALLEIVAAGVEKPASIAGSSNGTCPARIINYITHTLPQLCLTSTRTVSVATIPSQPAQNETVPTVSTAIASSTAVNVTDSPSLSSSASTALSRTSWEEANAPATAKESIRPSPTDEEDVAASDLDNARFLSFEDWKKQMLVESGQSEHVGKGRQNDILEPRRKPLPVNAALDSLGDDAEIEIDFSGFTAEKPTIQAPGQSPEAAAGATQPIDEAIASPAKAKSRSKDAGTTCKERFNYASYDCAATILKTNSQAKSVSSVLGENKDSYMLNECSADNKFLIMELCNDVLIDTVVLANFEFFSSIFRTFRVSVSDKYPVKADKWIHLGTFEARNSREVQAFLIENPVIWARYLRIEFLSHYGSEFFCPVSLIRVHGTTMMEDYKHDLESSKSDHEDDDQSTASGLEDEESLVPEAVAEVLVQEREAKNEAAAREVAVADVARSSNQTGVIKEPEAASSGAPDDETSEYSMRNEQMLEMAMVFNETSKICPSSSTPVPSAGSIRANLSSTQYPSSSTVASAGNIHDPKAPSNSRSTNSDNTMIEGQKTDKPASSDPMPSKSDSRKNNSINASADATFARTGSTQKAGESGADLKPAANQSESVNATSSKGSAKSTASSTQPLPASPTIQESFFKSVQKRIQVLESNSSLSLQYIEEQSRNLRDAFGKVEQRQMTKTNTFLDYLNNTVLGELRDFRQQYDQLWQSTVIELETQREQYQKDVLAINSRLGLLADEVVFQKRMAILQSVLVLLCIGLVLFSQGAMNNYLELPIVQNMLNRSPSLRMLNTQLLSTPAESPVNTRPSSAHRSEPAYCILKRGRSQTSESSDRRTSPEPYSPPTPTSYDGALDAEDGGNAPRLGSPVPDLDLLERPSSSPPVLPSKEKALPLEGLNVQDYAEARPGVDTEPRYDQMPELIVEEATPPPAKRLSFRLPDT